MDNPIKKFTTRDWLYIGGAVASVVAVAYLVYQTNATKVAVGTGTQTDYPQDPGASALTGYTAYNMPTVGGPVQSGGDLSPASEVPAMAGCGCQTDCAGSSPLATGNGAYAPTDFQSFLNYLTQTDPNYVALQQVQLQKYAALFATGESYSNGGTAVGVAATG